MLICIRLDFLLFFKLYIYICLYLYIYIYIYIYIYVLFVKFIQLTSMFNNSSIFNYLFLREIITKFV